MLNPEQAWASEIPETPPSRGESSAEQTPAQVFPGPVLRPLPLDNGALNKPGKLNSCLSPSEWELGLYSQLLGGLLHCRGRHSPGLGTSSCPGSLIMFRCTGDSVSKDHGKIRIFSAVYIFSDKPVNAGCYRSSKHFNHDVTRRGKASHLCLYGPPSLLSLVSRLRRPKEYSLHLKSAQAAGHLLPPCKIQFPPFSPSSHPPPHLRALAILWCFSAKLSVSDLSPGHGQHQTVGECSVSIGSH